ncbi:COX6C domain-containing protein [Aphelenchoides bicaudatus]|nr:COX6C domain-containing protein [Aphelenchoides bicaudatus]
MSSAPPALMRNVLQTRARRYIWSALGVAMMSTAVFNYFYVWPRYRRYEEYYKNYDAYERFKEICSYKYKYMHTCPSELAKLAEEKGKPIADLK